MKKVLMIITVITAVILNANCKSKLAPGQPFDLTPTATNEPTKKVSITVIDNASGNTTLAHDVDLLLHYPNNYNRTCNTASLVSGTAELNVYDDGQYIVEILPNTINGYSNSVFDTVDVKGFFNQKSITRYEPEEFTYLAPTVTAWGQHGGTFVFTFKCNTITPRKIKFFIGSTNLPDHTDVKYYFESGNETLSNSSDETTNNGDTVKFVISIPKYFQIEGQQLNFKITGEDSANKLQYFKYITLTQNWRFEMTASSGCTMDSFHGTLYFILYDIVFNISNFTEVGEKKFKAEYALLYESMWYDETYWGGVKSFMIGSRTNTSVFPIVLPAWSLQNILLTYENAVILPYSANITEYVTVTVTWGDFILTKVFSSPVH